MFLIRTVYKQEHPSDSLPRPEASAGATCLSVAATMGLGLQMFRCAPSANATASAPEQARRPIHPPNTWEGQITQQPPAEAAFWELNRPSDCSCGYMKCEALSTVKRPTRATPRGQESRPKANAGLHRTPRSVTWRKFQNQKISPEAKGTNLLPALVCHNATQVHCAR